MRALGRPRYLSPTARGSIADRPNQHRLTAKEYRQMLHQRIEDWRELTSLQASA